MRPYLAIIKDSFRAAMASRVLYVLLLLITLLLVAIAPFHIRETLDWELRKDVNVRQPDRMLRAIVEGADKESEAHIARIWELLPDKTRTKMKEIVERPENTGLDDPNIPGAPPKVIEDIHTYDELIVQLNKVIENREFYRPEDWEGRGISSEARELIDQGVDELSDVRSKRLNRLLIANAVPMSVDKGNSTALDFYYLVWRIPITVSVTHQQFAQTLTSELPVYFDKFVMSIGLLIAIVVTANMIPETFEPGSLNLLLSKPVSRWGLYSAKFLGGCVFIALCACYLFLGIWIWLGVSMDVWDRAILFSIPLYVLVFAIYFSVSTLVGLIWRSAIVSVMLTLLFWAFCFTIGSAYGFVNTKMSNSEFVNLLPIEEKVYTSDLLHQFASWDESNQAWDKKLEAELGQQGEIAFGINSYFVPLRDVPAFPGLGNFLAPICDQKNSRILASRYEFGQSMASGKKKLFVSDDEELNFKEVGHFPRDTIQLFNSDKGILAVTSDCSFYKLNELSFNSAVEEAKAKKTTEDAEPLAIEDENVTISAENEESEQTDDVFTKIGPDSPTSIRSTAHVDFSSDRNEFAVYRRGQLAIYRADGDSFNLYVKLDVELGFDKNMTCMMAYQGDTIFLAFGNGKVITIDAASLKEKNDYHPETRSGIQQVLGSPAGSQFGVLYRNGNLWMLDVTDDDKMKRADIAGQGEVNSFAFSDSGDLWISDNTDRVTKYETATGNTKLRFVPTGGWVEKIYRLALRPFYKACPKPGEFYKVVTHLSSSGDTESNEDVDLNKSLQSSDPWSPLWSGLVFMLGMLFVGCVIFHFKDY